MLRDKATTERKKILWPFVTLLRPHRRIIHWFSIDQIGYCYSINFFSCLHNNVCHDLRQFDRKNTEYEVSVLRKLLLCEILCKFVKYSDGKTNATLFLCDDDFHFWKIDIGHNWKENYYVKMWSPWLRW